MCGTSLATALRIKTSDTELIPPRVLIRRPAVRPLLARALIHGAHSLELRANFFDFGISMSQVEMHSILDGLWFGHFLKQNSWGFRIRRLDGAAGSPYEIAVVHNSFRLACKALCHHRFDELCVLRFDGPLECLRPPRSHFMGSAAINSDLNFHSCHAVRVLCRKHKRRGANAHPPFELVG